MATNLRTSPLKAFAKSPAKHQVHDGLDKVWHSNTQDGPHPNPNKKGEVITGPHDHKNQINPNGEKPKNVKGKNGEKSWFNDPNYFKDNELKRKTNKK